MNARIAGTAVNAPIVTVQDSLQAALREGAVELLPMPQVATRIVALAFDPASDAQGLAELIERDPTLAGHVMRVANSALYGPRAPLASLQQAVTWLGMQEVQNLAVALAVRGQVFSAPGHEPEVNELWRESVAAAVWARMLAEQRKGEAEVAYLCGLLHVVGRTAVIRAITRIESINRMVFDARSFSLLLDEFEGDFAQRVSADWRLPPQVAAAVTAWRNFESAGVFRDQAALTHAAVQLATASLHPDLANVDYLAGNPAFAHLGLQLPEISQLLAHTAAVRAFVAQL